MTILEKHEIFEIEVLEKLKNNRLLEPLVFGGGTMLRLCYELKRYSVDLDFWFIKKVSAQTYFDNFLKVLDQDYDLTDSQIKFYTLLFEIRSGNYPKRLKIEIRKEPRKIKTDQAIAYSHYSHTQVLVKAVSLDDMMREKIRTFLDRKEIRDVFDIEFLLKKGIGLNASPENLGKVLKVLASLKKKDYTVKLGSLLEETYRAYYVNENFKILKMAIEEKKRDI